MGSPFGTPFGSPFWDDDDVYTLLGGDLGERDLGGGGGLGERDLGGGVHRRCSPSMFTVNVHRQCSRLKGCPFWDPNVF